uniref:Uncharacterized protein n=1 Tax=Oryza punctata TaxID=4537 RepID=A0A0E0K4T2_ORYPU
MKPCVDRSQEADVEVANRRSWTHGRASWTNVREDALKTKTVPRSRQSLRKMTLKSRCSRTVKERRHAEFARPGDNAGRTRATVMPIPRGRSRRPP